MRPPAFLFLDVIGALELHERNPVHFQVWNQRLVVKHGLQANHEFGAIAFDKFAHLCDQLFRGIRHIHLRMRQPHINIGGQPRQPEIPHQPVILVVQQMRFRDRLSRQHQRSVRLRLEIGLLVILVAAVGHVIQPVVVGA